MDKPLQFCEQLLEWKRSLPPDDVEDLLTLIQVMLHPSSNEEEEAACVSSICEIADQKPLRLFPVDLSKCT